MMVRVVTESGARYYVRDGEVQRQSDNHAMRQDDRWIKLLAKPEVTLGEPMVLHLEPLSPDCIETVRTTTPVVAIDFDDI